MHEHYGADDSNQGAEAQRRHRTSWWAVWGRGATGGEHDEHSGVGRLEAFSDGVIAIAITLLVLEIRVPRVEESSGDRELLDALRHQWPSYLSYGLSFITIGIVWANHHTMFRHIRRVNHMLLMLNTVFLLVVGSMPFSTALLAEYVRGSHEEQRLVAVVYGGTLFALAVCFNVVWWYGRHHHGLLDPNADPRVLDAITASYRLGIVSYLAAFVVAWFYPIGAVVAYVALALSYALPGSGREG